MGFQQPSPRGVAELVVQCDGPALGPATPIAWATLSSQAPTVITGARMYWPSPVTWSDSSAEISNVAVEVELGVTLNPPVIFSSPEGSLASCVPLASVTKTFEICSLICWYSPESSCASARSDRSADALSSIRSYVFGVDETVIQPLDALCTLTLSTVTLILLTAPMSAAASAIVKTALPVPPPWPAGGE